MSAAISGMLPVSIPRFAGPGAQVPVQTAGGVPTTAWMGGENTQQGDGLDFDLLAEYLLDDGSAAGPPAPGMPHFDFSVESAPASGVVSPEQSEDGFPPVADATPTVGAPGVPQQVYHPPPQQPTLTAPPTMVAPVAPARVVPVPLAAPAPAPIVATAPALAHPGMVMPPTPAPAPGHYQQLPPAPIAAAPTVQSVVVHHHAGLVSKRRRLDAQTAMMVPGAAPGTIMNGHLMAHAMSGRGRQKTQAQIDRRRERNRILARRTRLRKKFFFESLQKEVTDLQRENAILKELAKKHLDQKVSKDLLDGCNAMEQLPDSVAEAVGEGAGDMDQKDFNLVQSIQRSQQCFVITDPGLQDNPIVYASDDFLTLTGYKREEVLGRNCRFLQGTETSTHKLEQLRKAVANGQDVSVTMINYTASGTAFWNKLFIAALRDAQNNIVNFIGVIVKVASPDPDDPEANKRLPGDQTAADSGDEAMVSVKTDANSVAQAADGTVKAIEGVVSAAVAAAPGAPNLSGATS